MEILNCFLKKKMFFWLFFFEKPTAGCDLGERYAPQRMEILNCFLKKKLFFWLIFFEKPTAGCDLGERYAPQKLEINRIMKKSILIADKVLFFAKIVESFWVFRQKKRSRNFYSDSVAGMRY